jgi:mRNA interferase RelE/StbE
MEVRFTILYHPKVVRDDIPALSLSWKERIKDTIEKKISTSPENYGKPLRQSLRGYRKLRVGEYRVIFRIDKEIIYILAIMDRSIVYKDSSKRIAE